MTISVASCSAVLVKNIPFNSGSFRSTSYIPKRIPDAVNMNRNKAEQHNMKTSAKENIPLTNFISATGLLRSYL